METAVTLEEIKLKLAQAQEELRRVQAENEDLRRKLDVVPHVAAAGLPEGISAPHFEVAGATERLIGELQRRLWDVLQRNSFLEQESHAGHNALIQSYEGYIDRLEKELRHCREQLRQRKDDAAFAPTPTGQS
ncbi:uncharacterized protein Tco025E_03996 [Trypanosoma conorhini]|uniref:Uncharacterized protein n=1 Tax=Trypanosoma conorhini TaxID=83891 RepID=A0A3R7LAS9_9TRYP|nr:uncharacterized protein Tco025E_03996 [Trypanosoma conorhini]RNF19694.1 hypothetical protein Tco025E_03996 [Trypanosoma conorhini]